MKNFVTCCGYESTSTPNIGTTYLQNIQLQQFVNYFRHCDTIHQQYDFGVQTLVGQDCSTIWKLIDKLRQEDMEERALERSFAQGNVVRNVSGFKHGGFTIDY